MFLIRFVKSEGVGVLAFRISCVSEFMVLMVNVEVRDRHKHGYHKCG